MQKSETIAPERPARPRAVSSERLGDRLRWLALLALSLVLVLAVYGRVLELPFFSDDFVHIAYMDAHSLGEIWWTIEGVGYYRPLTFAIWKVMYPLTDSHNPLLQHALNLLLHLGSGLLVAWLASRLWAGEASQDGSQSRHRTRTWLRRYLSAILFLLYPFSYQAVPWVGAVPHLLVTFLILAALATYIVGRQGGRGWLLLSLGCTLLALFTHENGVIVPTLIAAYELSRPVRKRLSVVGRCVLLWSLPVVAWLPLYFSIPSTASSHLSPGLQPVVRNTIYALQGLGYPLGWLGGWITRAGADPFLVAGLLGSFALIPAAVYLWRTAASPMRLQALFPLAWSILAVLPMILFLNNQYVLTGPRLLMLASAGTAWFWADVITRLLMPGGSVGLRRPALRPALALLFLGLILVHSFTFLRARMYEHLLIGEATDQAVAWTEAANAAGRTAVFVNFPHWIAPAQSTYALGTEGVVAFPPHAQPPLLASVHTGRPAQLRLLQYTDIRPALPYHTNPAGQGTDWPAFAAGQALLIITDYRPAQIRLEPVGGFPAAVPAGPSRASFGDPAAGIQLLAATTSRRGEAAEVHLLWQTPQVVELDVTVFVHVVDEAGQLLTQADGYPVGGTYPFGAFAAGQVVEDIRLLEDAGRAAALLVGLYRRDNGERLPAWQDGLPLPADALHLPLAPASPE